MQVGSKYKASPCFSLYWKNAVVFECDSKQLVEIVVWVCDQQVHNIVYSVQKCKFPNPVDLSILTPATF